MTFNGTHYFIDKGQERGLTYEALKAFETDLNTEAKTGHLKVHVVIGRCRAIGCIPPWRPERSTWSPRW